MPKFKFIPGTRHLTEIPFPPGSQEAMAKKAKKQAPQKIGSVFRQVASGEVAFTRYMLEEPITVLEGDDLVFNKITNQCWHNSKEIKMTKVPDDQ